MSIFIAPSVVLDASLPSLQWPVFLWDNLVTSSGIAADSQDSNYPASNLANPATASVWKSTSTASQNIVFTVDPATQIDAIGIARHNFGSTGCGVTIYGKTADVGATYQTLVDLSPGDDSPILAIVTAGYYTSIKITIVPNGTAPQAAVVSIGTLLNMPCGIPPGHTPLFDARDVTMLAGIAENGDFLGDIITQQRLGTSVAFKYLDGDWFRSNMRSFLQSRVPFFFAWAPAVYPLEVGFAKFDGSAKPIINQAAGLIDITIPLVGVAL
jgi:hypothetical protein